MQLKKYIIKIVEKLHYLVFRHEMSQQMREFASNVSWLFYAGVVVMPVSLLVGTFAGRLMGPAQFGEYNLVVLISSYLLILVFFGLDISTIKFFVKAKDDKEKQKLFSSSFVFVGTFLLILIILQLFFGSSVAKLIGVPQQLIVFVLIYTVAASFKSILDISVRAQEKFKAQALGKIIEIFAVAIVFSTSVVLLKSMSYSLYIVALVSGMAALMVYYFPICLKYFGNFSFETLKKQLSEGRFFMLSALLGNLFISSDRLLIAKFIDLKALGVYSAYYMASISIVAIMAQLFVSVLLPATAKLRDKSFSFKLDQLLIKGFAPVFAACCVLIIIFLKIFGRSYPLRADYTFLFAFVSALYFFQILYQTIIYDSSRRRYLQYFLFSNSINLLTILFYFIVLKYIRGSIDFVLLGFAINLVIIIFVQKVFVKKMRVESLQNVYFNISKAQT